MLRAVFRSVQKKAGGMVCGDGGGGGGGCGGGTSDWNIKQAGNWIALIPVYIMQNAESLFQT